MGAINVADILTMQDLANGHLDVKALGEAANGDENTIVTTRKGETYPSVKKAIKTMFENGGLPAAPFDTKALMDASDLVAGSYALVTNDQTRSNNGYYKKSGSKWVFQQFNLEKSLSDIRDENSVTSYQVMRTDIGYTAEAGYIAQDMTITEGVEGYIYSSPFTVRAGEVLEYTGSGAGITGVLEINPNTRQPIMAVHRVGTTSILATSTYITEVSKENKDYRVSSLESSLVTRILKPIKSSDDISKVSSFIAKNVRIMLDGAKAYYNPVGRIEVNAGWEIADIAVAAGDVITCHDTFDGIAWVQDPAIDPAVPNNQRYYWATQLVRGDYVCEYDGIVRIVKSTGSDVLKNGVLLYSLSTVQGIYYQVTQQIGSGTHSTSKTPVRVLKGDVVSITNPDAGIVNILFKTNTDKYYAVASSSIYAAGTHTPKDITWVAPNDGWILMSANINSQIYLRSRLNQLAASNNIDDYIVKKIEEAGGVGGSANIESIALPAKEYVFATAMNYILKTELIDGVSYIKISQDLGKTWTQMPNILGDIVSYHFYSDGTIQLCSPTKVFWTADYVTLNESTVYDYDGSVFVPTNRHFFAMQTGDKIDFVGNQEIHVWGDYHLSADPVRIWYSIDNGRTIKCALRFGITDMGGVIRTVTHVHRVYYHAKTNYFYVTTGDSGDQCMIIMGAYDAIADNWNWQVLNSGDDYKFGNIMIDDDNMAFMITDYTEPSQADKKGIYRVHASNLGDFSKYRMIYKAEPSEWGSIAPVSLLLDRNGNKVILPDYNGSGYIWVATDGLDFKKVKVSPNVLLTYTIGENYAGDVYCIAYEGFDNLRLSGGSYNLTKALRENGVSNFMRGCALVTGLKTVLS